jgi:hypothetical protein
MKDFLTLYFYFHDGIIFILKPQFFHLITIIFVLNLLLFSEKIKIITPTLVYHTMLNIIVHGTNFKCFVDSLVIKRFYIFQILAFIFVHVENYTK